MTNAPASVQRLSNPGLMLREVVIEAEFNVSELLLVVLSFRVTE
jgi:hypothetical protein